MSKGMTFLQDRPVVMGLDYWTPVQVMEDGYVLFPVEVLGGYGDMYLVWEEHVTRLSEPQLVAGGRLVRARVDSAVSGLRRFPVLPEAEIGLVYPALGGWTEAAAADPAVRLAGGYWGFSESGALVGWHPGGQGSDWYRIPGHGGDPGPSELALPAYLPEGVPLTVEAILRKVGWDPAPLRRGRRVWRWQEGASPLELAYVPDQATLLVETPLVQVGPEVSGPALYRYLLEENADFRPFGFSLQGDVVILALALHARTLREEETAVLITDLVASCHAYVPALISRFGVRPVKQLKKNLTNL